MSRQKLIRPDDGTKILIEGTGSKSGKTFLATLFVLLALDKHPEWLAFGNMWIDHERYEKVSQLSPDDFDPECKYIVVIDELDINYTWQESYFNDGLLAFWGKGASHNHAAVIATVQREYNELEKKYLRHYHIYTDRTLFNSNTGLPFAVAGEFIKPFNYTFLQNVEFALGKYDPWEKDVDAINLDEFRAERQEREYRQQKKNGSGDQGPEIHFKCFQCGHIWKPRTDNPVACPNCNRRVR